MNVRFVTSFGKFKIVSQPHLLHTPSNSCFDNRGWADFRGGFGNLNGEFWLGLDKVHRLTKTKSRLRVELEDTQGKTAYAEYDMFSVSTERNKYRLALGKYTGECRIRAILSFS